MPTLSDAIAAMKAGRREEARIMLAQVLASDGKNVTALLWMTEFAATPEEVRRYLKRVLSIDPANMPAKRGLELLDKANEEPLPAATSPLTPSQAVPDGTAEANRISPDNRTAPERTRLCPFCQKAILADSSFCKFCGQQLAAMPAAKSVDLPITNITNVDTVTGNLILLLIIGVLFWAVIGFTQIRMAYLGITAADGLVASTVNRSLLLTLAGIFSFALAIADLVVMKGIVQHRRRAYTWLMRLAAIGGVGALLLALLGNPGAIIGVPLCIIVAYLAGTIKEAFSQ